MMRGLGALCVIATFAAACGEDDFTASNVAGDGGPTGGVSTGGGSGGGTGGAGGATGGTTNATGGTSGGTAGSNAGTGGAAGNSGAPTGGAAGSGTGGGAAGAGGSGCQGECLAAAPTDWQGPIEVKEYAAGGSEPACTGALSTEVAGDYFGDFQAGAADCNCECDSPGYNTCVIPLYRFASACGAADASPDYQMTPGECVATTLSGNYLVGDAISSVGDCPPVANHTLEAPDFSTAAKVCGGQLPSCDGGGLCVPSTVPVCIYREGDHECPSGDYSVKTTYHTGYSDTRACSTCACGDGQGTCEGTVTFRSGACGLAPVVLATVANGSCTSASISPASAVFTYSTWTASCPPSGGDLSGSAEPTGPVTFCCAP